MKWRRVSVPKVWRPTIPGDKLEGYYAGRTVRNGIHGQYEVVMVLVPYKGAFVVSGTMLIQLADAAALVRGDAVRIVWTETKDLGEGKTYKQFELYVGESPRLEEDEMPSIDIDVGGLS